MVNNKIAQRAVAAGLSGLMAFGAAAPAALAYTNFNAFKYVSTTSNDDSAHWKRLAGDDRYGTMKEIVKAYNEVNDSFWKSLRKGYGTDKVYSYHSTVVLASGDNYPDALAANGLAGYLTNINLYQGDFQSVPVLITKSNSLTTETKDLLKGMQVQNVIIMGGTAAVSQDVEDAINKMGIGTSRVAGKDRQETSVKAMQRINGNWKGQDKTYDLIIASGNNYADALSISPYAYRMGTPIILTDKDGKLTDQEVEAIKANDKIKEIVIVGGTDAVKDDVLGQIGTIKNNRVGINVVRVAGADRYETSAKIAEFELSNWSLFAGKAGFSFNHAIVATGENFPDALVGGQLAGGVNAWMIDVNGFNAADFNDWSPCPLLLTKEGNTRADSAIAAGIGKYRVSTGTDTFESFGSWENTIKKWYDGIVINDKVLYTDLFGSWYNNAYPKFISTAAIDWNKGNPSNGQNIMYDGYADLDLTFDVTYTPAQGETATSPKNGNYTLKLVGIAVDGDTHYTAQATDITVAHDDIATATSHQLTVEGLVWKSNVHGVNTYPYSADGLAITLTHDDFGNIENGGTITISADRVAWIQKASNTQGAALTGWKEQIIGYVESDADFYGIILGGTKAISNDKRDDLENVVKGFGYGTDIFTVGGEKPTTITRVDAKGVTNTYSYLDLEATGVKAGATGAFANTDYVADVYHIYGTSSHVVCVFDKDGKFQNWYYYFEDNSQFAKDWAIPSSLV